MLDRLFPRQIDNVYRGHRLALWLLGLLLLLRLTMSANSIVNTRSVATGADGIPLDSFAGGGAEAVVSLFALLALSRLMPALLGILVLVRYRAMVPLLYLLLLIEHVGSRALLLVNPVVKSGASSVGLAINLALLALLLAGFGLSLQDRMPKPDDPI
jgi:hypothetical protein